MITVEHLTKYYGSHLAVDDISFEITQGHVYGFLGPNGAGKSTTMNIITGCLSATDGRVLIDGHDIFEEPEAAKKCIGYLPEHPPLYLNESVTDYLRFVGEAKGLHRRELASQIPEVLQKTGLEAVCNRQIRHLSKGYRQRVGIAQALLGDPKVIILDEPTVGLDPLQILEIRNLITELGTTHTVIFSSHILSEVQAICDRILMIVQGKLVGMGTPEELQQKLAGPREVTISTDAPQDQIQEILQTIPQITDYTLSPGETGLTRGHIRSCHQEIRDLSAALFRGFAQGGATLYEMIPKRGTLEDVFLELSENPLPPTAGEDTKEVSA